MDTPFFIFHGEIDLAAKPTIGDRKGKIRVVKTEYAIPARSVSAMYQRPERKERNRPPKYLTSPHVDRIVLLILESRSKNPNLSMDATWKKFHKGIDAVTCGKWRDALFHDSKALRVLCPDPVDSCIRLGDDFSHDASQIQIVLKDTKGAPIENDRARTFLWDSLYRNTGGMTPMVIDKAMGIAKTELRLHEINEDQQVLAGKIAWLHGLSDLVELFLIHFISEKSLFRFLVSDIEEAMDSKNDGVIAEFNGRLAMVTSQIQHRTDRLIIDPRFQIGDVKKLIRPISNKIHEWLDANPRRKEEWLVVEYKDRMRLENEMRATRKRLTEEIKSMAKETIGEIEKAYAVLDSSLADCRRQVTKLLSPQTRRPA